VRGLLEGLPSPAPLAEVLPSMLREDPFARQFCGGLDEVLAPVLLSLDSFPAYLDLGTTPYDMLPWLAQWVGVTVDSSQDPEHQRVLLRRALELHAVRGTAAGVTEAVRTALDLTVEVVESGASAWSDRADAELPGQPVPTVLVRVSAHAGRELDLERLDAVVQSAVPAHVAYRVEVIPAP
jgi:phage tail-like protein